MPTLSMSVPAEEYKLKEARLNLGERWPAGDKQVSTYDLVEQMNYLYVRVVKAKDLPPNPLTNSVDPYVEVKLGNYRGTTKHFEKKTTPEWNQVFAFSKNRIQSSLLEVFVRDKEMARDEYLGKVSFDLNEVPTRVPPDSPLAAQWYRLEDLRRPNDTKVRGEIMLAVWFGTQADEAFPESWHADAAFVQGEGVFSVRSKVYVSPKLWYIRLTVIEAQDIVPVDATRSPDFTAKAQLGNQILKTKASQSKTLSPSWNEDMVFVAAEPFEEMLVLTIEDRVSAGKDEILGRLVIPLTAVEKRLDHHPVHSRWFNLEQYGGFLEPDPRRRELRFATRVHLRVCLEGAYHVMDESTMYISDTRPTARQLWKLPIGVLEVGILGATELAPMKKRDGRGATDAYCVAKYSQKWVRTRTVLDSFGSRWNEQYTWEVYDPCTVITIGVFDNCHLGSGESNTVAKDTRIGKVRIRLSTLETDRIYTHSYPLIVLQPSGVKKMGELQLAVRFTCISLMNMVYLYGQPLLPKMHYLHPFSVSQLDSLRYQAMSIVAARLGRAEPPLRREVVEYMLDVDSHMWSMRRSKANFFRVMSVMSGITGMLWWLDEVSMWRNPATTVLVHVLFVILLWYPELILPTVFLYMFLIGLWNYRFRARNPPQMDTKMSWAEAARADELDEEFDTFPTTRANDVATGLFVVVCLGAAVALYVTPFRMVALVVGLYVLRHPRFRSKMPSPQSNFFKRLPSRIDSLL